MIDRITASADRSLRTRPSTRWEMNGSTIAIRPRAASSVTAWAQACRVAAVAGSPGSMRSSILPPSRPICAIDGGVVAGEPVVDLEHGPGQAAPVHRADDDLARPARRAAAGPRGCPRCPARRPRRAGPAPRTAAPAARPGRPWPSAGRRRRSAPRAGWSAAMMNSWPSPPSRDARRSRCPAALGDRVRPPGAQPRGSSPQPVTHGGPPAAASTSAAVGIASEQASRAATMAPAALANRMICSAGQPRQQPVAQRAAERVARAEAVDHLDRHRRDLDGHGPVVRQHALGALLDHGQLRPRGEQRGGRGAAARARPPRCRTRPGCRPPR